MNDPVEARTGKRDILIRRPQGKVPGLREVNDILRREIGWELMLTLDTEGDVLLWIECTLTPSADNPDSLFPSMRKRST